MAISLRIRKVWCPQLVFIFFGGCFVLIYNYRFHLLFPVYFIFFFLVVGIYFFKLLHNFLEFMHISLYCRGENFCALCALCCVSLNKSWLQDQQLLIHMQSGLKSKFKYHDLSFIWCSEEMYARICICVLSIVELKNNQQYSKS